MRYEHWDVLVFPASTTPCAPIPEFANKCFATHDSNLRAAVSDEGRICQGGDENWAAR